MVPPLLTSLDVDVWALAFAAFVTLVSVALAGLSAAHVSQWDRVIEDDNGGWVAALAERTKHSVESNYPRLTKALSSKTSKTSYPKNIDHFNGTEDYKYSSNQMPTTSMSTPPRRR